MIDPILICTRGRVKNCPTITDLRAAGIPMTLFVEPHEEAAYEHAFGGAAKIVTLPESGRGLAYARNAALTHAINAGIQWYWMLDDDLPRWYEIIEKRAVPITITDALTKAQGLFPSRTDLAMISIHLQQFAWSSDKAVRAYAHTDDAIAIHAGRLRRLRYDETLPLKVDRDFALQALAAGWLVARIERIAFAEPKMGTNVGGLHEVYASGVEKDAVDRMIAKWGTDICVPVQKDRGIDLVMKWRWFDPTLTKAKAKR